MFDDDFEAMLDAVCEAVDTEIPKLPRQLPRLSKRTRPPEKTELTKTDHPKRDNDLDYVPPPEQQKGTYDRSKFIFSNFKSNVVQEKLTPEQLDRIRRAIDNAKAQHGSIHADKRDFRYMGEVYPAEAAEALLLSGTNHWTGANLDDALEGILLIWLKDKDPDDIQEYVEALANAIEELKCMEGVYLRLNLNTIAQAAPDSIRIRTHFGEISQTKLPRKGVFAGELREKMKFFLAKQGKFAGNLNTVYSGLARIGQEYSPEQTLLSWMGYVVVRAMAENSKSPKLGGGSQLLIEDQSVAANIQ